LLQNHLVSTAFPVVMLTFPLLLWVIKSVAVV